MRYFLGIDGRSGVMKAELVLDVPRSGSEEEVEVSKGGGTEGRGDRHCICDAQLRENGIEKGMQMWSCNVRPFGC